MIRQLMCTAVLLTPLAATAQQLPTAAYLPLEWAAKAAAVALDTCAAEGYNVSVAVVAQDGGTKLLIKADGAGPHTTASAQGKAFASAALGRDTASVAKFIADNPQNAGMLDMDERLVIQAGGVPLRYDNVLVAGIGVGGAPSGDIDAKCAAAGARAIGVEAG